ncbi:MAG: 5-formyltetrahydrofolate cyclo-ligase [Firmicutes bacterium]|nr:5-formyltetrahydrofolate cyclo-ligase [Bacillota bacterium]
MNLEMEKRIVREKRLLRLEARKRRDAFFLTEERLEEDRLIFVHASALFDDFDTVLAYSAFSSEACTMDLMKEALKRGKRLGLPKIYPNGEMVFYQIDDLNSLLPHAYGMLEPTGQEPVIDVDGKSLMLLPGLAFDRTRHRLGYGGGYYDRYLENRSPGLLAGIGYSVQLFESVPQTDTDHPLDVMILGKDRF